MPLIADSQTISVKLDSTNHLIADWITLFITADIPINETLDWTDFKIDNPNFDTVYLDKIDTTNQGDFNRYTQRILLTCYDTGWQEIPSFNFSQTSDSGSKSLKTKNIPVFIGSIPVDTTKGLKVIKGPIGVETPKYGWVKWVLFALLIVLILAVIVYFIVFREKSGKLETKKELIVLSPYQKAIKAFEKLSIEKSWLTKGEKYFYTQVSDIIRVYLNEAKSIKTLEQSSTDILSDFEKRGFDQKCLEELTQLLNLSDKVKFAKALPEEEYHLSIIDDGIKFINDLNKNQSV
jgi:hypothetical protein